MSCKAEYTCDSCGKVEPGLVTVAALAEVQWPHGWDRFILTNHCNCKAVWHSCGITACKATVLRRMADELEAAEAKWVKEMGL